VPLEIYPGEFVSSIGPSGSGKSTLLHCMGLLDRPASGKILIYGKDTLKISGKEIALFRGEKLGFVFQSYNLIPRLTVLENMILPGLIMEKEQFKFEVKLRFLEIKMPQKLNRVRHVFMPHILDENVVGFHGGIYRR